MENSNSISSEHSDNQGLMDELKTMNTSSAHIDATIFERYIQTNINEISQWKKDGLSTQAIYTRVIVDLATVGPRPTTAVQPTPTIETPEPELHFSKQYYKNYKTDILDVYQPSPPAQKALNKFMQDAMLYAYSKNHILNSNTIADMALELEQALGNAGIPEDTSWVMCTTMSKLFWAENSSWRRLGTPTTSRSPLGMPLHAISEQNKLDARVTEDTALSILGEMSRAHKETYLILYQKLEGKNTNSLSSEEKNRIIQEMKEKVDKWQKSWLKTSLFYIKRLGIPKALTAAAALITLPAGAPIHIAAAVLAYAASTGFINKLTQEDAHEQALTRAAAQTIVDFDGGVYVKPETAGIMKKMYKTLHSMRCGNGRDTPPGKHDAILLGELRKNFDDHEDAAHKRQHYITVFSKVLFGAGITYIHWDTWSSMLGSWLNNTETAGAATLVTAPMQNAPWVDKILNLSWPVEGATIPSDNPLCDSGVVYGHDNMGNVVQGPDADGWKQLKVFGGPGK